MLKHIFLPNIHNVSLEPELILWYNLSKKKGPEIWYMECYKPVEGSFTQAASRFVRAHFAEVDSTQILQVVEEL
jgi:hypothetical protein